MKIENEEWEKEFDKEFNFIGIDHQLEGYALAQDLKSFIDIKRKEALAEERERVRELIKSRKPNEYAVRQYKTMEARTWDEKNLVIEALDDLLASLTS